MNDNVKINRVKQVNMVFLLTVLSGLLGSLINGFIYSFTQNMAFVMIGSQLFLILPALGFILINHLNLKEVIRFHSIKPGNIVLLILFAFMVMPAMSLINMISMLFVKNDIQNVIGGIADQNPLWFTFVIIALVPCILEESVYRGVFYNEYRNINLVKGMLLSGLLFAVMHMNFNQFCYAFIMGVVFVLIVEATDSILASMIVHLIINGTSVIQVYMLPKLYQMMEALYPEQSAQISQTLETTITKTDIIHALPSQILITIITSVLAFIIFRTILKNTGRMKVFLNCFKKNESSEKFGSIPLYAGMCICIVYMILNEFAV